MTARVYLFASLFLMVIGTVVFFINRQWVWVPVVLSSVLNTIAMGAAIDHLRRVAAQQEAQSNLIVSYLASKGIEITQK